MKKTLGYSIIMLVLLFASNSCEDVLDQKAVDSFNEESVFEDVNLTEAFLGKCYDYIGGQGGWWNTTNSGTLGLREDLLAAATDEALCIHRPGEYTFVKGTLSPDQMGHFGNPRFDFIRWEALYSNIKNVNILLANIDDVPTTIDPEVEQLERIKGEAYFIRAFDYVNLMRSYGGLILIDEPFELDQDFLSIQRSSIDETLDFILSDIDQAIALLPEKDGIEQGRATKGAAAALKSRILSWSTGILMHGDYSSDPLVSFQSYSRESLLQQAKTAAKDIMDGTYGHYALTGSTDDPPTNMTEEEVKAYADNFTSIFTQTGEWNDEVMWGVQHTQSEGNLVRQNQWWGPNGYHNWGNNNPLEPVVRKFEMKDGSPFDWDKYNPGDEYVREFSEEELEEDPERNPYNGREPRFYATVLYDGAPWQPRPSDMAGYDPHNRVQTGFYVHDDGSQTAGIDTRQAEIEGWNGTKNGYYIRKYMEFDIDGQYFQNRNTWVELRYAEVVMDYAEACIELGEVQDGIDALNMIRNRAGLPDRETADQDQAREWYRQERQLEFFGEGDRWYMIRKWMIADEVITDVHPMRIYHYDDGSTKWHYDTSTTPDNREWKEAAYWLPISRTEMNKAPQLTQNPGY
ncbi:MAG: RagB/SusD family nutrient uptake outer membrane protein [Bacteroidota bacterium]